MKRSIIISIVSLAWLTVAGPMARAQETNNNTGLDYRSFQIISRQNMFDPSRRPRSTTRYVPTPTRVTRVDSFTLVGTMSYEQGQYAFFDSTSYQYRKTLKPADTIAGYKIVQIAPNYVKLAASSNRTINLPVGTRMRRQEGGPWMVAGTAEPEASIPTSVPDSTTGTMRLPGVPGVPEMSGAPAAAPSSASESDALKRLMLKRLQEK